MHPRMRVRPDWPAPLGDYDYTRFHTRSRWAWEFLRRNEDYFHDWLVGRTGYPEKIQLTSKARVTRLRHRSRKAEGWGLCFFRRSAAERNRNRGLLAPGEL